MTGALPRLTNGPRMLPLAAVAVAHVALASALVLMPGTQERLSIALPMFVVELRDAPREPAPEVRPLPKPALRDPVTVIVPLPPIALAPEVTITPPPQRAPTISGPIHAAAAPTETVGIEAPRFDMAYLRNPPPAYPNLSRRMREQGRVVLSVLVSAAGDAQNVEVRISSGSERLDQAAIEAVRRWRFAPARRGSETIAAYALVPILFELGT